MLVRINLKSPWYFTTLSFTIFRDSIRPNVWNNDFFTLAMYSRLGQTGLILFTPCDDEVYNNKIKILTFKKQWMYVCLCPIVFCTLHHTNSQLLWSNQQSVLSRVSISCSSLVVGKKNSQPHSFNEARAFNFCLLLPADQFLYVDVEGRQRHSSLVLYFVCYLCPLSFILNLISYCMCNASVPSKWLLKNIQIK
jgi:hypothetical protein